MNRVLLWLLALAMVGFANSAKAYHVEPLMVNGPDSEKIVISIIGDGYDIFSQQEFIERVDAMIVQGLFPFDETYRNNSTAFNIYRIDALSNDYGVTVRTTYEDPVTHQQVNSAPGDPYYNQDTALGYIQSGIWNRCWMEEGPNTSNAITSINSAHLSRLPDYTLAILNVQPFTLNNGVNISVTFGGCARGSSLAVTNNVDWSVVAHEWGHGIGGLRDEYTAGERASLTNPGTITGATNCSTVLDRNTVYWSGLVSTDPRLTIPTTMDWNWMDSNTTVGEFEGCNTYGKGVYRATNSCRMNGNWPGFCPVCKGLFQPRVASYVDQPSDYFDLTNYLGARCRSTGSALNYTTDGAASNPNTSSVTVECAGHRVQSSGVFSNHAVASVKVVDRNPSSDNCCKLIARNPDGTQLSGAQVCSQGSSSDLQTLQLVYPKLILSSSNTTLNVECTIAPVSSGIASNVFDYQLGQQLY